MHTMQRECVLTPPRALSESGITVNPFRHHLFAREIYIKKMINTCLQHTQNHTRVFFLLLHLIISGFALGFGCGEASGALMSTGIGNL